MLFAPIVPAHHLALIEPYPYHMSLAHLVPQDLQYGQFYKKAARNGNFVILDNGAAESGQMPMDEWVSVVRAQNPSEVVLYDAIGDAAATKELTKASFIALRDFGLEQRSLMGVPHGKTSTEIANVMEWMLDQPYITTIGFSKFWTYQFRDPSFRLRLLDKMQDKIAQVGKVVHVLGCHGPVSELVDINLYHGRDIARGCDTAMPTLFTKADRRFETMMERPDAEIEFLEETEDSVSSHKLATNVAQMFRVLQ